MLADLYEAFQEVVTMHISYGAEMSQDFYGALEARLRSMFRNDILVDMLNTPRGSRFLSFSPAPPSSRPVTSPLRPALLMGALTAGIREYLVANPKREVSHLLVLEEAHHLLKRAAAVAGYASPPPRRRRRQPRRDAPDPARHRTLHPHQRPACLHAHPGVVSSPPMSSSTP